MQWDEVRRLYPDKWVQLEANSSYIDKNKKIIKDVTVIRSIDNDLEATKLLLKCSGDTFVYHTSKPQIVMNVIRKPSYRGHK
ncbi:hypothetical protein CathTA2_1212 [Caldalkalibacillus thermarum TA2.A1]|uniref:Uncharacterized protein n=2 Tax=Caldalkalibacillus TaxID=379065 RepID=F5L5Z9_CALTT|nr:hypothetical protein [Caldalkalibacillus thermarum]EGL83240.1 hypothetical protein CathTA2_1212 [Caldalkalibacillus thermarum TA2.A1]QZT35197.1 hypothetical protein HUR95_08325 [Caldalkalibacillus thermarum TA2.A1]GGK31572.1 hypothetical protein GCM10010965_25480 [Caldalkalibacillus thermarum]